MLLNFKSSTAICTFNKSIYDFIYMVLKGKDYKKKLRNSSVSTYYEYMDKKCGYRIKEDIKNNIL